MQVLRAFVCAGIWCAVASAQQTFDVASVKPAAARISSLGAGRKGPPPFATDPQRLAVRALNLRRLISYAYGVDESLISGGPAWTEDERYDIDAKTERPATREQMMRMLGALLADRFRLQFHRTTRTVPQNVLVVAKNGPKYGPRFHPAQDGSPPAAPRQIVLKGKTMKDLAFFLTDSQHLWDPEHEDGAGPPVLDQTGLSGTFDIVMSFVSRRDWLAVMEQDLGLKVEMRKQAAEIFVIDGAAKPAAN